MPAPIHIDVSANWARWISGLDHIDKEMSWAGMPIWRQATETMFDRSQEFVHVITGRLLGSGSIEVDEQPGALRSLITYDAPYAAYEHARGGSHAFMDRAFEATSREYEEALSRAWEAMVITWK